MDVAELTMLALVAIPQNALAKNGAYQLDSRNWQYLLLPSFLTHDCLNFC
jgi:hypothetical protein